MSKVIIPKRVAEAINELREDAFENRVILCLIENEADSGQYAPFIRALAEYSIDNYETLLSALVNGYAVEQTAEEELEAYYRRTEKEMDEYGSDFDCGKLLGIEETLRILRLEIPGINLYKG